MPSYMRKKKAMGGGLAGPSGGMPMQAPAPQSAIVQKTGLFPGAASGRGDTLKATVPAGTYIIPADVVSALGDGNTASGAKILDRKFGQDSSAGPQAKPMQAPVQAPAGPPQAGIGFAKGGRAPIKNVGAPVPIMASSGEYRVLPKTVQAVGGGDIDHGHKILDNFVKLVRKDHVKKIKSLPPPKK